MDSQEIWKDIKGYEGYYQASTLGRIKSINRYVWKNGTQNIVRERILKPQITCKGYYAVFLYKHSIAIKKKVHRLVAETFLKNSENKMEVNHKDLNKQNNIVLNLEWASREENIAHAVKLGAFRISEEHLKAISKPIRQYTKDGIFVKLHPSGQQAGRDVGVCAGNIFSVANGRRKTAGGYVWKYHEAV